MRRIIYIDGMKGIAILLIILMHTFGFVRSFGYENYLRFGEYDVFSVFKLGQQAAELFFVINGFLLGLKFLKEPGKSNKVTLKLITKSLSRIVIPYVIFLLLTPLIKVLFDFQITRADLLIHLFLLHSFLPSYILSFPTAPLWFIGTLFWLNVFFYFVLARIKKNEIVAFMLFCIWICNNYVFSALLSSNVSQTITQWYTKSPVYSLYYFLIGLMLAKIYYVIKRNKPINKLFSDKFVVSSISTVTCFFIVPVLFNKPFDVIIFSAFYVLLLLGMFSTSWVHTILSSSIFRIFGKISMSLYLWHLPIYYWISHYLKESNSLLSLAKGNPFSLYLYFSFFYFSLLLLVAYAYFIVIEQRLTNWIKNSRILRE